MNRGALSSSIENVRFEFTADRLLRVTVLAKGSVEHNVEYMSSIPGWDGPMPANRKFRYAAVTRTWRIRN